MAEVSGNTSAWPTPQGAVPASVGAPSSGSEVESILKNLAADQTLVRQAITPVAGQHVGQIPTALTKQVGPAPQSATPYERPRSKGEAIANMITSAGNAVSQVITAEKQQKQTHITDAATKLFTSQQALDEAQQTKDSANAMLTNATGEEAKGYQATIAQADKLIKQNTDARNSVLADPKMRKALAKGLNINYIDPSENKTEEHQAVQAALKNAKTIQEKREAAKKVQVERNQQGAQNFGEAFAKTQPQTMGQNQLAQQAIARQQAAVQQKMEVAKLWAPFDLQKNKEAADAANTQAKYVNDLAVTNQDHANRIQELTQNQSFEVKLQGQRLAGERDNMLAAAKLDVDKAQALQVLSSSDPSQIAQAEIGANKIQQEALARFDARRDTLLASMNRFGVSGSMKELLRTELEQNTKDRAKQEQFGATQELFYKNLKDKAIGGTGGPTTTPSTSTAPAPSTSTSGSGAHGSSSTFINRETKAARDFFSSFLPKQSD